MTRLGRRFEEAVWKFASGLDPGAEVRFEFVLPLDDPSLVLLYYDGQSYRHWDPSAEWELLNPTLDPFAF